MTGKHGVVGPLFSAGADAVGDLCSLLGPPGHGSPAAEIHIIRMGADDQSPPTFFPFCNSLFQSVLLDRSPVPDVQVQLSLTRFVRGRRAYKEKIKLGVLKNYGFFSPPPFRSLREKNSLFFIPGFGPASVGLEFGACNKYRLSPGGVSNYNPGNPSILLAFDRGPVYNQPSFLLPGFIQAEENS